MSLSSILNSASSALQAQQMVMNTISENIANATTPGYTTERTDLVANPAVLTPQGPIGTGVTVGDTSRLRDTFLDDQFRAQSSLSGQYSTTQSLLNQVQGSLNEPSDNGLSAALGNFFNAFSNLSANPNDPTSRLTVQQSAQSLVQQFHSISGALTDAGQNAVSQLQANVTQANNLLGQIQKLNAQIVAANGAGGSPTLQDQRDQAIDQLSSLVSVRTVAYGNGSVGVMAGNTLVADSTQHATLGVVTSGAGYGVGLNGATTATDFGSGSIAALSTFTQTTLPGYQSQLDGLASSLVSSVNAVHTTGTVTGSNPPVTGIPFFDPTATSAASIALSSQVAASPNNVTTGTTGAAGDNTVAQQIAGMSNGPVTTYANLVAGIGDAAQSAQQQSTAQGTLVSNIDSQRSATDGVNTDQQLVNMIETQNAYAAATHLINAADSMMQSLLQAVAA